jgi:hypothetical protein
MQELKQKILQFMKEERLENIPTRTQMVGLGIKHSWIDKYGGIEKMSKALGIPYMRVGTCESCGSAFYTRDPKKRYCEYSCKNSAHSKKISRGPRRKLTYDSIIGIASDLLEGWSVEKIAKTTNYDPEYLEGQIKLYAFQIKREMQARKAYRKYSHLHSEGQKHIYRPYETKVKRNIYGALMG